MEPEHQVRGDRDYLQYSAIMDGSAVRGIQAHDLFHNIHVELSVIGIGIRGVHQVLIARVGLDGRWLRHTALPVLRIRRDKAVICHKQALLISRPYPVTKGRPFNRDAFFSVGGLNDVRAVARDTSDIIRRFVGRGTLVQRLGKNGDGVLPVGIVMGIGLRAVIEFYKQAFFVYAGFCINIAERVDVSEAVAESGWYTTTARYFIYFRMLLPSMSQFRPKISLPSVV